MCGCGCASVGDHSCFSRFLENTERLTGILVVSFVSRPICDADGAVFTSLSLYVLGVDLLLAVPFSVAVVQATQNCYPSAARLPLLIECCYYSQRVFVAEFRQRDDGALVSPVP